MGKNSGLKMMLDMVEHILLKYKRCFYGSGHFFVIIDLSYAENQRVWASQSLKWSLTFWCQILAVCNLFLLLIHSQSIRTKPIYGKETSLERAFVSFCFRLHHHSSMLKTNMNSTLQVLCKHSVFVLVIDGPTWGGFAMKPNCHGFSKGYLSVSSQAPASIKTHFDLGGWMGYKCWSKAVLGVLVLFGSTHNAVWIQYNHKENVQQYFCLLPFFGKNINVFTDVFLHGVGHWPTVCQYEKSCIAQPCNDVWRSHNLGRV